MRYVCTFRFLYSLCLDFLLTPFVICNPEQPNLHYYPDAIFYFITHRNLVHILCLGAPPLSSSTYISHEHRVPQRHHSPCFFAICRRCTLRSILLTASCIIHCKCFLVHVTDASAFGGAKDATTTRAYINKPHAHITPSSCSSCASASYQQFDPTQIYKPTSDPSYPIAPCLYRRSQLL
jgi:hypothetical protein